jgi:hypothetical protein
MADRDSYEIALFMRKLLVWKKGRTDVRYNSSTWRMDSYGRWMKFEDYGTTGQFGWELDHIMPVARGGKDELANLQPLHWESNRAKSDSLPPALAALLGRPILRR